MLNLASGTVQITDATGADPGRLRIAWSARSDFGFAVESECITAAEEAARLCERLGHEVEEAALHYDVEGEGVPPRAP